jgi:mono/diheme cytochrome c family protein
MLRRYAMTSFLFALTACKGAGSPTTPTATAAEVLDQRGGLALADEGWGDGATKIVYLEQGWGPVETLWYYFADQGSGFMPYDTLVHLEQPGSEAPLIHPENMARFRFLAQRRTPNNPDALPVGMVRHEDRVGLTCAACHTAQINYRGTAMRSTARRACPTSSASSRRWSRRSRPPSRTSRSSRASPRRRSAAGTRLSRRGGRASLSDTLGWFTSYLAANRSSTVEGFARMDAVGRIINQVIRFTSDPKYSLEPNAPTNFPHVWDAPRSDYVQWPGFSPNWGAGSLGRNAGEVVGTFGQVQVKHYETKEEAKRGYPSSVQGMALVRMEEALRALRSPLWPEEILPPLDRALASRGEAVYRAQCQTCHALIDRADPRRRVTAMITGIDVVGTDPQEVKNLVAARAPTGVLEGAINTKTGERYGAEASALALLANVVTGALSAQPAAAAAAIVNAKVHGIEETAKQGDHRAATASDPTADLLSYKARPLNGIWATAPFLHNGSVPTLYDLLLPPAARPKRFTLGRREFDPKKVGYVSDGEVPFVVDTSVTGNGNGGHEYGVTLAEDDRWALVEYLKTL